MYDAMQVMAGCIMPPRPEGVDSPNYSVSLLGSDGSGPCGGAFYYLGNHFQAPRTRNREIV